MLMYESESLDQLLRICKENSILCIADEVMTGFGRTGKLFACDFLEEEPDIICLSKGITGGTMALGVTACKDKIYNAFLSDNKLKTLFHGHSYTANPLACAAGCASMDLLLEENTRINIQRICDQQKQFAEDLKFFSSITSVRFKGTIVAFDVKNEEGISYFNSQRDELYHYFLEKGMILRPLGNTLYIMPPYCISWEDLDMVHKACLDFFKSS